MRPKWRPERSRELRAARQRFRAEMGETMRDIQAWALAAGDAWRAGYVAFRWAEKRPRWRWERDAADRRKIADLVAYIDHLDRALLIESLDGRDPRARLDELIGVLEAASSSAAQITAATDAATAAQQVLNAAAVGGAD